MEEPKPLKEFFVDKLLVSVYPNRDALGRAAGEAVAARLRELLARQQQVSVVFAAAPSQNEFLAYLSTASGVDWSRVVAMHMDEYLGLAADAPPRFGRYLDEHLFSLVKPGKVYYINGNTISPTDECERYTAIIQRNPVDIVCLGIGENGHIAFNDPPLADFFDPLLVKVVTLDERSRWQQVHDGCFASIDQVPKQAITLTIPAIFAGRFLYCIVPGSTKREAVKRTLTGEIAPDCPATILRRHEQAKLFLDVDSSPFATD
ncbi:MAG: glucosamine-6-phosphate deaminase [Firmicutes bacterium]|nr:glucosamine-6-phosphate deaminase [Bacillota bacterium]